ncbi:aspartate-semialdehyde dehydrogenase [bacterium]|nr:aspartate-semialdehyde dehydrogenase [bacterium]
MEKIKVAILGATGTVGQRFVQLLGNHVWFEISELVASDRSAGKPYHEAVNWKLDTEIPQKIKNLVVKPTSELKTLNSKIAFSGLDSTVAGEIELECAKLGLAVVSNASNYRMEKDVPLIIPEINSDHLSVLPFQQKKRGFKKGFIVTNSNCAMMFFTLVFGAIQTKFKITKAIVTTMQAISGAGYPGVASMDILGNVIPFIKGEADKVETEPQKILGKVVGNEIVSASFPISASVNRVPVFDGHLATVSFGLEEKTSVAKISTLLKNFVSLPQELKLPTAPNFPVVVREEADRPQPRLDLNVNQGMSAIVGKLQICPVLDFKMTVLGHNTIRGAAGAAILNAELLFKKGLI